MKIALFLVLAILAIFFLIFLVGFVVAFIKNKKENQFSNHAFYLFNQLSEKEKDLLKKLWLSFQQNDSKVANELVKKLDRSELKQINTLLDPTSRPTGLSAGKTLDRTTWFVYFNKAKEMGLDDAASSIVAGIGLNGIEEQF